ncbi:acyltransferase family protein [Qipengyuania flava]|uniref:acyltransferase family protein n=1 Tax=Qipengyuania flava TaxID=192812 RepID=UPI001C626F55|nr:acyltransferase [Qipengyuania flava]QYJ06612.1 acyltransferase [Qipengyuania flava]
MSRPVFITPSMSILLDAVRAIAALLVLGGHMVQMELYTGPYPFGPTMQHNAVIVFFVLSGLVIAHSVSSRSYTLKDYAIARASRIVPVAFFAIGFGTLIFAALSARGLAPAIVTWPYDELSLSSVLLPAVFLSESGDGVGPVWNPPYWSLTYEVWFYILFAAGFFLRGPSRWFWLAALCWVAGLRVLLMFPIWLLGAALVRYGTRWEPKGLRAVQFGLFGFILCAVSNVLGSSGRKVAEALQNQLDYAVKFSEYFLTDYLFGIGIAMLFIAARPFAEWAGEGLKKAERPVQWFAGFSFSLYILHWPMLSAMSVLGIEAGGNPLAFLALVGGIIGACALVAQFTEYRSKDVRRWLTARLSPQPRQASAT